MLIYFLLFTVLPQSLRHESLPAHQSLKTESVALLWIQTNQQRPSYDFDLAVELEEEAEIFHPLSSFVLFLVLLPSPQNVFEWSSFVKTEFWNPLLSYCSRFTNSPPTISNIFS